MKNLSLLKQYELLRITYSKEAVCCCDHCGRAIANIATITDNDGATHYVGLDCAATLSGIRDTRTLYYHEYLVQSMKSFRAKIKKYGIRSIREYDASDVNPKYPHKQAGGAVVNWIGGGWNTYSCDEWALYKKCL